MYNVHNIAKLNHSGVYVDNEHYWLWDFPSWWSAVWVMKRNEHIHHMAHECEGIVFFNGKVVGHTSLQIWPKPSSEAEVMKNLLMNITKYPNRYEKKWKPLEPQFKMAYMKACSVAHNRLAHENNWTTLYDEDGTVHYFDELGGNEISREEWEIQCDERWTDRLKKEQ